MAYTPNTSFLNRIIDYIGDVVTDYNENGLADVFDTTLREVLTILPAELVISRGNYSVANGNKIVLVTNAGTSLVGGIFIRAHKIYTTSAIPKVARMVGFAEFAAAGDANSIYAASEEDPVCNIDELQLLKFLPTTAAAETEPVVPVNTAHIYVFDADYNESTETSPVAGEIGLDGEYGLGLYARTIIGYPIEAHEALILKVCLNYLAAYVGEAVQEDEDGETLNLVNTQMKFLEAKLGQELIRLGVNDKEPVEV